MNVFTYKKINFFKIKYKLYTVDFSFLKSEIEFLTHKNNIRHSVVSQIAKYNYASYFLLIALSNMHFVVNLTFLESFKGRVLEKAKMRKNLYDLKNTLNL